MQRCAEVVQVIVQVQRCRDAEVQILCRDGGGAEVSRSGAGAEVLNGCRGSAEEVVLQVIVQVAGGAEVQVQV